MIRTKTHLAPLRLTAAPTFVLALALGLPLALPLAASSHEGHHHGAGTQEAKTKDAKAELQFAYKDIEAQYVLKVSAIFDAKCAACHSKTADAPWYAVIPGISGIVADHRAQAQEHIEISQGFPFGGHGEPIEDLGALRDVVANDKMPTQLYRFLHPSAKLTDDEKALIIDWADDARTKLSSFSK